MERRNRFGSQLIVEDGGGSQLIDCIEDLIVVFSLFTTEQINYSTISSSSQNRVLEGDIVVDCWFCNYNLEL